MDIQVLIDETVEMFDQLDPIMGFDLMRATAVTVDEEQLSGLYDECLDRANVHGLGSLRTSWIKILDNLTDINLISKKV